MRLARIHYPIDVMDFPYYDPRLVVLASVRGEKWPCPSRRVMYLSKRKGIIHDWHLWCKHIEGSMTFTTLEEAHAFIDGQIAKGRQGLTHANAMTITHLIEKVGYPIGSYCRLEGFYNEAQR